MSLVFDAMMFARDIHKDQRRKYSGNPYADHLAEVAGIAMSVGNAEVSAETLMAVCWLHDSMEDQGVAFEALQQRFGVEVATGVRWLSDLETGNRAERKRQARERLGRAPGWVQTIKCADLISNTSSIVVHDQNFARVYLREKRDLLPVLTKADERLRDLAWKLATQPLPVVRSAADPSQDTPAR